MSEPVDASNWGRFTQLLAQSIAEGQSETLLGLMLTPDEREAIAMRLRIVEALLNDEVSQRQLKEELGVGIATITRGSHGLKSTPDTFRQWLTQQLNQQ